MEGTDVVTPVPTRPPGILHIRKNTQKSKFLLSQAFNWKKIMFFVIPEMPSKTFVIVQKNFLITLRTLLFISALSRSRLVYMSVSRRDTKTANSQNQDGYRQRYRQSISATRMRYRRRGTWLPSLFDSARFF